MDTNTVQVIQQFGNKLDSYIFVIASKSGQTVEHFWPIFVRQQVVTGWSELIICILFFIVGFILLYKAKYSENENNQLGCVIFAILTLVFASLSFAALAPDIIGKIVNPEYSALKEVINLIK